MLLARGKQDRVLVGNTPAGGQTLSVEGSVATDSILVTLWVDSVTSGSVTLRALALTDAGKETEIIEFPAVSAPTTSLLLRKAAVTLQRFRIEAVATGQAEFEVYVRSIEGAGEASVRILGASSLETSSATVTTVPAALLPAALTDRSGITIRNYSGAGNLFLSESLAKLPADAWPVGPGEGWSLDVGAGVTIYAVASAGVLDVRIAQSGT